MLCRCETHGWPDEGSYPYVAKVEPAGASNEAIICGRCETPGDIYLNVREYDDYEDDGKRLYTLEKENIIQFRVSDSPEEVRESPSYDGDDPVGDSAAETDW